MEWADDRVLVSLRGGGLTAEKAIELYAHILGAEQVWLDRLRRQPSTMPVWPRLTLGECEPVALQVRERYAEYLAGLTTQEPERLISYANSAGEHFENRVEDILIHVALHGTYHRGQVAMLLRSSGQVPTPTDYIQLVRGTPAATRQPG